MQFCDDKLKNKDAKFFKFYDNYPKIMFIPDLIQTKYTFKSLWIFHLRPESFNNRYAYFKQWRYTNDFYL